MLSIHLSRREAPGLWRNSRLATEPPLAPAAKPYAPRTPQLPTSSCIAPIATSHSSRHKPPLLPSLRYLPSLYCSERRPREAGAASRPRIAACRPHLLGSLPPLVTAVALLPAVALLGCLLVHPSEQVCRRPAVPWKPPAAQPLPRVAPAGGRAGGGRSGVAVAAGRGPAAPRTPTGAGHGAPGTLGGSPSQHGGDSTASPRARPHPVLPWTGVLLPPTLTWALEGESLVKKNARYAFFIPSARKNE